MFGKTIKASELVNWIRDQVLSSGAVGCVFGLSGGIDSAVVGVLCKKAFPGQVLGLVMPCDSASADARDACKLAKDFSIPIKIIELEDVFYQLLHKYTERKTRKAVGDLPAANLKPRLRMLTLYYFANQLNYLVIGTGNKSEALMGYATKYGDAGVDLLPLGNLLKTEVRKLARELGVPKNILDKAPSAGLWPGQTDEGEMGITYDELDKIILGLEQKKLRGLDPQKVKLVKEKIKKSAHKRKMPPVFRR